MKLLRTFPIVLASLAAALHAAEEPGARVAEGVAAGFKRLDRNGDGRLTSDEYAGQRWIKRLDADADGAVTWEEAQALSALLGRLAQPQAPLEPASPVAPPAFQPENSPRQEPKRLRPGEHGIGTMIADLALRDLDGKAFRLSEYQRKRPLVLALISPSCPVSKRYLPTLAQLEKELAAKDAGLLLIAPTATDTPQDLRAALSASGLTAPCVPDPSGAIARTLGATASTDAFLFDGARTLIYRGAVDDQYGLGYSLDAPRHRYLADALEALLAGRAPAVAATEAPGCVLDLEPAKATTAAAQTFHNRISRILQASCMECHRTGGVAPFPLETYEQVSAKSGMIRRMVERNLMPPWFAAAPAPGEHSPWANDRSLAARDKADLLAWLAAGKPEGNPADAPLARQWPSEWRIGKPDAIFQIPQPIAVKAAGTMPYQHVTLETGLAEDRWVRALEVQPTAREVVHHVLIHVLEKGVRESRADGLNGFFAAYVPGSNAVVFPEGFAKPLPAGARLRFEIHYTPNGEATHDQVRLGVMFAKEPPRHVVRVAGISNIGLKIPAGAENHAESGLIPVPREVRVLAFMPHMHVRGKAFRYEAILPGGAVRTMLEVPRYDFNWQLQYRYAEPPLLPAGSRVRATGWFDNSANNPANPDPAKIVRWGPQTTDEMMLGYVEYFIPGEAPRLTAK
jgi:peroxiredoxin